MAEPATVYQGSYLGVEVTPGTAVDTIVKLAALDIDPTPAVRRKKRRTAGHKFPTSYSKGKESTTARVTGEAGFYDLLYFFSGLMGAADVAIVTAAKTWDWTWLPDPGCSDDAVIYTVQKGCGSDAAQFPYGTFSGGSLTFNENEVTVAGDMFGAVLADGIDISDPIQDLPDVPFDPDSVDVYVGTASDTFTILDGCSDMVWNLGTRRKPKFYLKKAVTSFSKVIELDFPSSFQLTVAKDSVAASLMTDMRGRTKKWVKVVVTGPPIPDDNTKNHTLTIISPVEIIASDRGDKDDLYTATFNMDSILDTVFGSGIQVVIRCGVDTLTNVTRLATLYAALQ